MFQDDSHPNQPHQLSSLRFYSLHTPSQDIKNTRGTLPNLFLNVLPSSESLITLQKFGGERSLVASEALLKSLPTKALPEGRTPILVDGLDLVQEELVSEGHRVILVGILTLGWWFEGFGSFLPECHLHNNKTLCSVVLGWEELWEREVGVSDLSSTAIFLSFCISHLFIFTSCVCRVSVKCLWPLDLD